MKTSQFDYGLPPELIAQRPAEPRDSARLMVIRRASGHIQHRAFREITEYLGEGDLLVANDTRVIPARLWARKIPSGGKVEVTLTRKREDGVWEALVSGRRVPVGQRLEFGANELRLTAVVEGMTAEGGRLLHFDEPIDSHLEHIGQIPLPPYIKEPLADAERYQTVYARSPGSVAAPTAGLHFTSELMERLKAKGVEFTYLTLHIGPGTFRPIATEEIEDHRLEAEYARLSPRAAESVNRAKIEGRRVISVGTTAVRVLESAARDSGLVRPWEGWIDLFIYPGFQVRIVDALITNFHLPRSSLLALVAAFAGKPLIDKAYSEAIARSYRFYSFGDAMFIM